MPPTIISQFTISNIFFGGIAKGKRMKAKLKSCFFFSFSFSEICLFSGSEVTFWELVQRWWSVCPIVFVQNLWQPLFPLLFPHYLAETKLGVPLLTMIRFDPDLQDILELDSAKGVTGKIFLNYLVQIEPRLWEKENIENQWWQISKQINLQT